MRASRYHIALGIGSVCVALGLWYFQRQVQGPTLAPQAQQSVDEQQTAEDRQELESIPQPSSAAEDAQQSRSSLTRAWEASLDPQRQPEQLIKALRELRRAPDAKAYESLLKLVRKSHDPGVLRGVFLGLAAIAQELDQAQRELAAQELVQLYLDFHKVDSRIARGHSYSIVQTLATLPSQRAMDFLLEQLKDPHTSDLNLFLLVDSLGRWQKAGAAILAEGEYTDNCKATLVALEAQLTKKPVQTGDELGKDTRTDLQRKIREVRALFL